MTPATLTLLPMPDQVLIYVPDGRTCPVCESLHFVFINRHGRTRCACCPPAKEAA